MLTFFICLSVLSVVFVFCSEMYDVAAGIDYSALAGEAEKNKGDILNFLNKSDIRAQYQSLYDSLVKKLSEPDHRRGSTRRIVSGLNTSIAAVPWQVSLREKSYPICGGAIITDLWIITAAHCLLRFRASDVSVRVGSSWKTHGGEMYDAKQIMHHPKYVSKTKANDVGLVELYTPLRFSPKILPIGVVAKFTKIPAGQGAVVSGWGKLKEGGPSAMFLQATTIKTIAMKLCKSSGLNHRAIDPSTMFCAGSFTQPSPDACQGDSGGPIVSNGILVGVVSWGLGCARGNFPGVYTRISQDETWDWIHNTIKLSLPTQT